MQTMDENVKGDNQGVMNYVIQSQKADGTSQIEFLHTSIPSHPSMLIIYDLLVYA